MARQLRVEYPGAIYYVTCRMVGDAAKGGASWPLEKRLFRDDADNERFVERLSERVKQFNIRLYLFVCTTNHVHLVFEARRGRTPFCLSSHEDLGCPVFLRFREGGNRQKYISRTQKARSAAKSGK